MLKAARAHGMPMTVIAMITVAISQPTAIHNPPKTIARCQLRCYGAGHGNRVDLVVLTERTERAIEACYDAALAPALWPDALQRLGESVGALSCNLYCHARKQSAAKLPISSAHEQFAELWLAQSGIRPDAAYPKVRTALWVRPQVPHRA